METCLPSLSDSLSPLPLSPPSLPSLTPLSPFLFTSYPTLFISLHPSSHPLSFLLSFHSIHLSSSLPFFLSTFLHFLLIPPITTICGIRLLSGSHQSAVVLFNFNKMLSSAPDIWQCSGWSCKGRSILGDQETGGKFEVKNLLHLPKIRWRL